MKSTAKTRSPLVIILYTNLECNRLAKTNLSAQVWCSLLDQLFNNSGKKCTHQIPSISDTVLLEIFSYRYCPLNNWLYQFSSPSQVLVEVMVTKAALIWFTVSLAINLNLRWRSSTDKDSFINNHLVNIL